MIHSIQRDTATTADEIQSLIEALDSDDLRLVRSAQNRLVAAGAAVIEPLMQVIQHRTITRFWEAADVLARIGDPNFMGVLHRWLGLDDLLLAVVAMDILTQYDRCDHDLLIQVLPYAPTLIQLRIVKTLGDKRVHQAVRPLMDLLLRTSSVALRRMIIEVLGTLGDPQAIDLIRRHQHDEDHRTRQSTHIALNLLEY